MFKPPSAVPQDLLLIQELVSTQELLHHTGRDAHAEKKIAESKESSIASSGEDSDSESEVEVNASLIVVNDTEELEEKGPEERCELCMSMFTKFILSVSAQKVLQSLRRLLTRIVI
jgi:hypothetical protein